MFAMSSWVSFGAGPSAPAASRCTWDVPAEGVAHTGVVFLLLHLAQLDTSVLVGFPVQAGLSDAAQINANLTSRFEALVHMRTGAHMQGYEACCAALQLYVLEHLPFLVKHLTLRDQRSHCMNHVEVEGCLVDEF